MREAFWDEMYRLMKEHDDIMVLISDTGFKVMDAIREEFGGSRCLNVGIAEQNMIGMASGLAAEGFAVYCYAIDPFVNLRPYEQIRDDVCIDNRNVKLIGIGAGFDYWPLGSTHHSESRFAVMRALPNMTIYSPCDEYTTRMLAQEAYRLKTPVYISLSRYSDKTAYEDGGRDLGYGFAEAKVAQYADLVLVSTGVMVKTALEVADILAPKITTVVLDIFQLKPITRAAVLAINYGFESYMATIEEHSIIGGLGSLVAELIAESDGNHPQFRRFGMPDTFIRIYGDRDCLMRSQGLAADQIAAKLREWIGK